MSNPQRREVWLVDLGMLAKVRPVLVLSIALDNADRALIAVVPHTTALRGTRFEIAVRSGALKAGAFDCQNLVTIPQGKFLRKLGEISATDLGKIETTVREW